MLNFICGVMGSGKTQKLIYDYKDSLAYGNAVVLKPDIDTRTEEDFVKSRTGEYCECINFGAFDDIRDLYDYSTVYYIFVDEVQFCTTAQIEQLKELSELKEVSCYGLRTDFKGRLFDGSKRLIELADDIVVLRNVRCSCGNEAIISARFNGDKIIKDGDLIQIGDEEYKPMCWRCYENYKEPNKM